MSTVASVDGNKRYYNKRYTGSLFMQTAIDHSFQFGNLIGQIFQQQVEEIPARELQQRDMQTEQRWEIECSEMNIISDDAMMFIGNLDDPNLSKRKFLNLILSSETCPQYRTAFKHVAMMASGGEYCSMKNLEYPQLYLDHREPSPISSFLYCANRKTSTSYTTKLSQSCSHALRKAIYEGFCSSGASLNGWIPLSYVELQREAPFGFLVFGSYDSVSLMFR